MSDGEHERAGWDQARFEAALRTEDYRLRLAARDAVKYAESDAARDDQLFPAALVDGYDAARRLQDNNTAYEFAVALYRLGKIELSHERIIESGTLLAEEEYAKADAAFREGNDRRASDKGVWAMVHFADVMEELPSPEIKQRLMASADLMLRAHSRYSSDIHSLGGFEDALVERFGALGLSGAQEMIITARTKHLGVLIAAAVASEDDTSLLWLTAFNNCEILEHYGAEGLRELQHYLAVQAVESRIDTSDHRTVDYILSVVADRLSPEEMDRYVEAAAERALLKHLEVATKVDQDSADRFVNWENLPHVRYSHALDAAQILRKYRSDMDGIIDEVIVAIPEVVPVVGDEYEWLVQRFFYQGNSWAGTVEQRDRYIDRLLEKAMATLDTIDSAHPEAAYSYQDAAKSVHNCLLAQHAQGDLTVPERHARLVEQTLALLRSLPDQEYASFAVEEVQGLRLWL